MSDIAQHSSVTNEHFTPPDIVERARALLGGFDLDPASCEEANKTIGASRIYTIEDDGLSKDWSGRVFLNPPGGKLKKVDDRWITVPKGPGKSSLWVWWQHLAEQWKAGRVSSAFFVGFQLEIMRTSQAGIPVQSFQRCYPKERIAFRGKQPTHPNVLVYLPGVDDADPFDRFVEHFGDLGLCEGGNDWWSLRDGAA